MVVESVGSGYLARVHADPGSSLHPYQTPGQVSWASGPQLPHLYNGNNVKLYL